MIRFKTNTTPRTVSFYGESVADLTLMPTTTKLGEGDYPHILAPETALATILTEEGLKLYMLRSTGWIEVKMSGGGGGEPGVTSYNDLTDKPQINGVELINNTSLEQIAQSPEPGQSEPTDVTEIIDGWFE